MHWEKPLQLLSSTEQPLWWRSGFSYGISSSSSRRRVEQGSAVATANDAAVVAVAAVYLL